jgi:AcrR family transcriptional regulator
MMTDRDQRIEHLLLAALPEFARSGLAGARVDAIARAAGMNKRLLYHYVGDKEALHDAVLDLALKRILSAPYGLCTEAWRVVCHAAASGHPLDLSALAARIEKDGKPVALGLALLAALLPQLADRLLGNSVGDEAGRAAMLERAIAEAEPLRRGAKPRLKLRPDLRKGEAG